MVRIETPLSKVRYEQSPAPRLTPAMKKSSICHPYRLAPRQAVLWLALTRKCVPCNFGRFPSLTSKCGQVKTMASWMSFKSAW
jgi:hypothetical protein